MSFEWAALMPHPPILVPQVGKGREREARLSLEGTRKLTEALHAAMKDGPPDVLLLLSPHQPHSPGALFLNNAPTVRGNLARFGAPDAALEAACPKDALEELATALHVARIPVRQGALSDISPDHAAIVPLLLLREAFPKQQPPPLILAGPSGLSLEHARDLGLALRSLKGRRWALLASGDLSHRLKEDGPYGLHPDGAVFDRAVVESLKKGDPAPVLALSPRERENAAECGLRPVLTLLALAQSPLSVYSYEGPFGVGYCTAFWPGAAAAGRKNSGSGQAAAKTPAPKPPVITGKTSASGGPDKAGQSTDGKAKGGHPYARLARATVSALLSGLPAPDARDFSDDAALWSARHGCFVSIKNTDGSLRGCIGTFMPTQPGLDREIMTNAVSAATRDPRFPPMSADELATTRFSVDVLSEPETLRQDMTPGMSLDPKIYGVIVSKGGRRGLLLPDLEGVDSVEKQLSIAAGKAGIRDLEGAEIQRFTVQRYKEDK